MKKKLVKKVGESGGGAQLSIWKKTFFSKNAAPSCKSLSGMGVGRRREHSEKESLREKRARP